MEEGEINTKLGKKRVAGEAVKNKEINNRWCKAE
jgi:hypothetical protein